MLFFARCYTAYSILESKRGSADAQRIHTCPGALEPYLRAERPGSV